MGPHEGDTPIEFFTASIGHRRKQLMAHFRRIGSGAFHRCCGVLHAYCWTAVDELGVCRGRERGEPLNKIISRGRDLSAQASNLLIPHFQRAIDVVWVAAARCPSRLQERVSLFEYTLIVRAHSRKSRLSLNEEVIEESAALRWISFDEREILRRKDHGSQDSEDFAGARNRHLVDSSTIRSAGGDLDFNLESAGVPDHFSTHEGTLRITPD